MHTLLKKPITRLSRFALLPLLLCAAGQIHAQKIDLNSNGMSDIWEFVYGASGLDPMNPSSNGQLDGNGQPLGDYAYATGKLASQNVITIAATDPAANQPDPGHSATDMGSFTISRGGFPLNTITVNLAMGGPGAG